MRVPDMSLAGFTACEQMFPKRVLPSWRSCLESMQKVN